MGFDKKKKENDTNFGKQSGGLLNRKGKTLKRFRIPNGF
jgi:hypothetical protein